MDRKIVTRFSLKLDIGNERTVGEKCQHINQLPQILGFNFTVWSGEALEIRYLPFHLRLHKQTTRWSLQNFSDFFLLNRNTSDS